MKFPLLIAAVWLSLCLPAQSLSYAVAAVEAMEAGSSKIIDGRAARLSRKQGLLLVEGKLDGELGHFIVDTGSPGLIVNSQHHDTEPSGTLSGATGTTAFAKTRIDLLEIAGLRQRRIPALAIDLSYTEGQLGIPLLGLIGYQQLKAAPLSLKLSTNEFSFHTQQTEHDFEQAFAFEMLGHLPIIKATVGDTELSLAFDSGSSVNLIDERELPQVKDSFRGRPATRTLSGVDSNPIEVPCALVRLTFVEVADFTDRPFLFVDLAAVQQTLPGLSGLISPSFWGQPDLMIDYSKQHLVLNN